MSETTGHLLTEAQLNIGRLLPGSPYEQSLLKHIDALQATNTRQAWDMRSLEATVENLRGEVARLRTTMAETRDWVKECATYPEELSDWAFADELARINTALEGGE